MLATEAMKARKKVLGADHPSTLSSMANLAFTRKAQGRIAEAVVLIRQYIQLRQRVLRVGHPDLKTSLIVLEQWETE